MVLLLERNTYLHLLSPRSKGHKVSYMYEQKCDLNSEILFFGISSRIFLYIPLIYIRLSTAQVVAWGVRGRRHCSALTDDLQPLAQATLMHLCFPI